MTLKTQNYIKSPRKRLHVGCATLFNDVPQCQSLTPTNQKTAGSMRAAISILKSVLALVVAVMVGSIVVLTNVSA